MMRNKISVYLLLLTVFCINFSQAQENNSEYTVGADDVLEINILAPEKLTTIATVTSDGFISYPYIGNIKVQNMTLPSIQNEIQKKLSDGYMKYPVVSVSLKESRSKKFFIYGEVNRPGAYPMEVNMTVLKAISIAGGFIRYGTASRIKVLRQCEGSSGPSNIEVNVKQLMNGVASANIPLQPLDTIVVSEAKFFIQGEVNHPGAYPLEENTTVLRAVSIAGGFTLFGGFSSVKVLRPKDDNSGNEVIEVDIAAVKHGNAAADIVLKPQDTVSVSQGKFFVYGEVNRPGCYPMEENTTVIKAVAIAGGFTKYGSANRIKVLRSKEDGSGHETIKVNMKEMLAGSSSEFILKPQDTVIVSEGVF